MSSDVHVESVEMMDGELCQFSRDEAGLHIQGTKGYKTEYPVCFKIKTE